MSETIFQASEEKSQSTNVNYLTNPYLGPVSFTDFVREKVGNTEDCFVAKVKLLGEDIEGNDVSGIMDSYIEWNPTGKEQQKIENAVNRLNYFVQHLVPKEKALAVKASSWVEYVDKMIQLLKQENATDRSDVEMKFLGSVWQGKPRISTPGYNNFIANKDSKEELTWSQKEIDSNKEYLKVKNSTPDSPDEAEEQDLGEQQF